MNKLILAALCCTILWSCSSTPEKKVNEETPKAIGITHKLYKNKLKLTLAPRYERFNMEELLLVLKGQNKASFFNQLFNEQKVKLAIAGGVEQYTFIDTSTYEEILILNKLDNTLDINKNTASVIGGLFMKNMKDIVKNPNATVEIDEAKYGAQRSFKYGFYDMHVIHKGSSIHSSQFAISSSESSYVMYNLSNERMSIYDLQHNIQFNE